MIELYDRDGGVVAEILGLVADVLRASPGTIELGEAQTALERWTPPDLGEIYPPGLDHQRARLAAARLKSIVAAILEQQIQSTSAIESP